MQTDEGIRAKRPVRVRKKIEYRLIEEIEQEEFDQKQIEMASRAIPIN